jgi:hypothetical protein
MDQTDIATEISKFGAQYMSVLNATKYKLVFPQKKSLNWWVHFGTFPGW